MGQLQPGVGGRVGRRSEVSPGPSRVFITWYPYCRRSDALAEQIGARSYLVHYLRFKVPWMAPIKYVLQTIKTLGILLRERPLQVLVAETDQGRGIVGVVDGSPPKGKETEKDVYDRKEFLRRIGYKL